MNRLIIVLFFIITSLTLLSSFDDFGPSKPHLLFQVGDRYPVGISYGFSYWRHNQ